MGRKKGKKKGPRADTAAAPADTSGPAEAVEPVDEGGDAAQRPPPASTSPSAVEHEVLPDSAEAEALPEPGEPAPTPAPEQGEAEGGDKADADARGSAGEPEPSHPSPPAQEEEELPEEAVVHASVLDSDQSARLSAALLARLVPSLQEMEARLAEIRENQGELLAYVEKQTSGLGNSPILQQVHATMAQVPVYTQKLAGIRKDMLGLHDRASKLKVRANKLKARKLRQQKAADDAVRRAQQREASLMAKPAEFLGDKEAESETPTPTPTPTPPEEDAT